MTTPPTVSNQGAWGTYAGQSAQAVLADVNVVGGSMSVAVTNVPHVVVDNAVSSTNVSTSVQKTITSVLLVSVQIVAANPNRKALRIWNNSSNSVYVCTESPALSNRPIEIITTFTSKGLPDVNYTGALYAIRNSGSGNVVVTEFL